MFIPLFKTSYYTLQNLDQIQSKEQGNNDDESLLQNSTSVDTLSQKYSFNLAQPRRDEHKVIFFAIRDQVVLIENWTTLNGSYEMRQRIEQRIHVILHDSQSSSRRKLAELGALYYSLHFHHCLLPSNSYLDDFQKEIVTILNVLKQNHHKTEKKSEVSGRLWFHSMKFTKTILPKTGIFNVGGLFSLIWLLQDPSCNINLLLTNGHRKHLLAVLQHIFYHPGFTKLLTSSHSIHPTLKELSFLEIKDIHADEESPILLWGCLMAFLFDFRQGFQPNCFSISTLKFMIHNYPYKTFTMLLDFCKTGTFEQIKIPISAIVQPHLTLVSHNTDVEHSAKQITSFFPFMCFIQQISDITQDFTSETINQIYPIQRLLKNNLREENKNLLPFFEKYYQSFQHSPFILMILSLIEFAEINCINKTHDYTTLIKPFCIEDIIEHIKANIAVIQGTDLFFNKCKERIEQRLWLVPYPNQKITSQGNDFYYGPPGQRTLLKKGLTALEDLKELFSRAAYLYYFDSNQMTLLSTITQLQTIFVKITHEIQNEESLSDSSINSIINFFSSTTFRVKIAEIATKQINYNNKISIHSSFLSDNDFLIFNQWGGRPIDVLENFFKCKIERYKKNPITAFQFIYQVSKISSLFSNKSTLVVIEGAGHAWTLNCNKYNFLAHPSIVFHKFIMDKVFKRAEEKKKSSLPHDTMVAIINNSTQDDAERLRFKNYFKNYTTLTYESFKKLFLRLGIDNQKSKMETVIDEEYNKIYWQQDDLVSLLKKLQISDSYLEQLSNDLAKYTFPISPYIFARKIRKLLIKLGIATFDTDTIEHVVYDVAKHPFGFHGGDYNWGNEKERPFHTELHIRYNWISNTLRFYIRYKTNEKMNGKSIDNFSIYYPQP